MLSFEAYAYKYVRTSTTPAINMYHNDMECILSVDIWNTSHTFSLARARIRTTISSIGIGKSHRKLLDSLIILLLQLNLFHLTRRRQATPTDYVVSCFVFGSVVLRSASIFSHVVYISGSMPPSTLFMIASKRVMTITVNGEQHTRTIKKRIQRCRTIKYDNVPK